jgi:hypothetical protein
MHRSNGIVHNVIQPVLSIVKFIAILAALLVSVHLIWVVTYNLIPEKRQKILQFESDMYRVKEHRAKRLANSTMSRVSSGPRGILPEMNSFASKFQSGNKMFNETRNDIDNNRKAHEASMFPDGQSRESNDMLDKIKIERG